MYWRDREGVELAAIAKAVRLDGTRVLDVGCGTGRLTSFAAQTAARVYAFDPNAESIAQARASLTPDLAHRVNFAVHSAEALDLARRRFDTALCGWSI
jgi:FkbM family methyltransferase